MATSKDTDFAGSAPPRDDLVAGVLWVAPQESAVPPGGQVTTIANLFGVTDEQLKQADRDGAEQRSRQGVVTLSKAAALIVNRGGALDQHTWRIQLEDTCARLQAAAAAGKLRMRHPLTLLEEDFTDWPQPSRAELVATFDDLNAWLEAGGVPYRLHEHDAQTVAPAAEKESSEDRERRRYEAFLGIGGKVGPFPDFNLRAGKHGALADLARLEKVAGRPRSDARYVAKDIKAEAERRRSKKALPGG